MTKYNILTEVFNPSRGMVEIFLCSTYAFSRKDAVRQAKEHIEPGEKLIVRLAK